jgi:DnaJ like chaperone protein
VQHWGKLIGFGVGYYVGGVIGALFGLFLGSLIDKNLYGKQAPKFTRVDNKELGRIKAEFFNATFSVMGYIAQTSRCVDDGEDSQVTIVVDRMGLPLIRQQVALLLFEEGKESDFPFQDVVGQFYVACRNQPDLLEMFVEIQLYAAMSNGSLDLTAKQIILNICYQLNLSRADFASLERLIKAELGFATNNKKEQGQATSDVVWDLNLHNAYAILNMPPNASNKEVKMAYRRLTSKHHPDKLVAQGLPDEMMKLAEVKTREIRGAYEKIRAIRHF